MTELPAVPNTSRGLRSLTIVSLIFVVFSPFVGLILATVDLARASRRGHDKRVSVVSLCLNCVGFCFTAVLLFLVPWITFLVATRGSGGMIPPPFEYSAEVWSIIFGG